jgi:hypothetical protein
MKLIFKILKSEQKGEVPVEVILKRAARIICKETVENPEKILEGLDKILKRSKISITDIKSINIDNLNQNRYTSYRITKSIKKALKFALRF